VYVYIHSTLLNQSISLVFVFTDVYQVSCVVKLKSSTSQRIRNFVSDPNSTERLSVCNSLDVLRVVCLKNNLDFLGRTGIVTRKEEANPVLFLQPQNV